MNGNFEWQQQQTRQRIQQRMGDAHQHRLAKKENDSPALSTAHNIVRLPLRLVTAVFALIR